MHLPDRHLLIGMTLGAFCATALAMTGPGMVIETFADDLFNSGMPAGFDPANLVKFEGRDYQVNNEDWVATDPLSTVRVKKIEGGRVSYVTITTTETGTYSTDAMFSRHVQYPGIEVSEVPGERFNRFAYWGGHGWNTFASVVGNSFSYYRSGDTGVLTFGDTTCVISRNSQVC